MSKPRPIQLNERDINRYGYGMLPEIACVEQEPYRMIAHLAPTGEVYTILYNTYTNYDGEEVTDRNLTRHADRRMYDAWYATFQVWLQRKAAQP